MDQDEAGQKMTDFLGKMIKPGKAKVAKLPENDANDTLIKAWLEDTNRMHMECTELEPIRYRNWSTNLGSVYATSKCRMCSIP